MTGGSFVGSTSRVDLETFFEQKTKDNRRPTVQVIMLAKQLQIQSAVQAQNDPLEDNRSATDVRLIRTNSRTSNRLSASSGQQILEEGKTNHLQVNNKFFTNIKNQSENDQLLPPEIED